METLVQANIFFFITSITVLVVGVGLIFLIIKIQSLVSSLNILIGKLTSMTDFANEEAEELVEDIKESFVFRLFFPKTKRKSKKKVARKINN